MKYILITHNFQKQLKKLRRYLQEQDIVEDLRKFIQHGIGKGEAYLEMYTVQTII